MNVPGDSPLEAYGPKAISWRSGASSGAAAELCSVATTWKSGAGDGSFLYEQLDCDGGVVREVRTDAGEVCVDRYAQRAKVSGRSDPRAEEERRTAVGPRAEDDATGVHHLAAAESDSGGATALHNEVEHLGLAANVEVRTLARTRQIREGGAHPDPVEAVDGHQACTDGSRRVVILDVCDADVLERGEARRRHIRQLVRPVAPDRHRACAAMPRAIAEIEVALQPPEGGQDVVERPAGVAAARPGVVVGGRAAQCEGRVGRRAAAEQPAARQRSCDAELVGLTRVAPVETCASAATRP